jgi:hypothetical protein
MRSSKAKTGLKFGFAAGCEARALPRRSVRYLPWATPVVGVLP